MSKRITLSCADLFCGGGGFTLGLQRACKRMGVDLHLVAVNHWDAAINTHSANHPDVHHICASVQNVDPRQVVPGQRLDVLLAAPECIYHSRARGGKPVDDQSRMSAWAVLDWAEKTRADLILCENVPDFAGWTVLDKNNLPVKERKGEIFEAYINAMKALGYVVEYRVLTAADYGAPTSRKRLFIVARRDGKMPVWPKSTHAPPHVVKSIPHLKPYRTAREIIDWDIPGQSIFQRERPLVANTMRRIFTGLNKFSGLPFIFNEQPFSGQPGTMMSDMGKALNPYLVTMHGLNNARDIDRPAPAVLAGGNHLALAQPFLLSIRGGKDGYLRGSAIDDPVQTVTGSSPIALVQPKPEPFVMQMEHSTDASGHRRRVFPLDAPLRAVTGRAAWGLVEPFIIATNHGRDDARVYSLGETMRTITGIDAWGIVQPFLVSFNGTGGARSLDEPVQSLTTHDHFGLVIPRVGLLLPGMEGYALDILLRMLCPHELAAAQSFPKTYVFLGTRKTQVKLIGNAVPPDMADALCYANVRSLIDATHTKRPLHSKRR